MGQEDNRGDKGHRIDEEEDSHQQGHELLEANGSGHGHRRSNHDEVGFCHGNHRGGGYIHGLGHGGHNHPGMAGELGIEIEPDRGECPVESIKH